MHVFPLNRPLCPRLQMVADFVRDGAAPLPISARITPICPWHWFFPANALARLCPICVKCRWKMRVRAIRRYHLEDRIVACLSDGLDEIAPDWAQDIIIAGMGGELIAAILARAPLAAK